MTRVLTALLAVTLAGCPIDRRTLAASADEDDEAVTLAGSSGQAHHTSSAGRGGSWGGSGMAGGLAGAGESDESGAGGVAGEPPRLPPLVDGCADLDENGAADCKESEVSNSRFVADVDGWRADTGVSISWSTRDAYGDETSGSALVEASGTSDNDALGTFPASQCVPVVPGETARLFAEVRVSSGQGMGFAGLQVWFFDAPGCVGSLQSSLSTPYSNQLDTWLPLSGEAMVPRGAKSASVRLAVIKPFKGPLFATHFDNVLFATQ